MYIYKKKMFLLEDLKMLPLSFCFVMIYAIHKILILFKNKIICVKDLLK